MDNTNNSINAFIIKKIQQITEFVLDEINRDKIPPELSKTIISSINFRRELSNESDRGCALLASAHLEFLFEKLLRKTLVGDKKHLDVLFNFNGPLGSFSNKISLSYSLGLIPSEIMHDTNVIRRIRNEFGHSPNIINFTNEKIITQCNTLKLTVLNNDKTARNKFLSTFSGIAGLIEIKIYEQVKLKEAPSIDLIKRKKLFDEFWDYLK